jgi:heat shock protein HslJ
MRLTTRPRRGAGALVVLLALSLSCWSAAAINQVAAQPEPPALVGTFWRVTAYNDGGTVVAVLPDTALTARFSPAGLVSGETSCNVYGAAYRVEGATVAVGPIITTLRACLSEAAAAQEHAFLAALSASSRYTIAADQLTLSDASGATQLELVQHTVSLGGTPWQVVSYNNGRGGVVSVSADSTITALFGDDGRVSGDTGCNRYEASYTIDGRTIAAGPIATTRRACSSEDLATQEALFLTALGAATRYELIGDKLTLRNDAGAAQVILVRPAATPAPAASSLDAAYEIEGQWVTLVNGYAATAAAPDAAVTVITQYFGNDATGDVDGTGTTDVAFLLTQTRGGSGVFYYIVVALETRQGYVGTNGVLLGDRVAPQTTAVQDGEIIVNYADRQPGEPLTTPPSVGITKVLHVVNGRLVEQ